ncbi:pseudouridine synthase [Sphingosinicella xenopeptidilytica]|uniref:Pseudouridine synthase n=1 Tax=Sphingosinicella xenopeptidilytica TaxID=364098 RepID=A0ABW3C7Q5_SPHXN
MTKPPRRSGPPRRPSKAGGPARPPSDGKPQRPRRPADHDRVSDGPRAAERAGERGTGRPVRERTPMERTPMERSANERTGKPGERGPRPGRRFEADDRPSRRTDGRPSRRTDERPTRRSESSAAPAAHRPGAPQRIAKLLARAGVGSRRDIERMIAEGRVSVAGTVLTSPALNLTSLAEVTLDGNPVAAASATRLYFFHKPTGCLTTARDPKGRATIYDLLPKDLPRLVTIGRLDMNTEGLLMLTNDGELKRAMELPANALIRRYRVRVFGSVNARSLEALAEGVTIEGVRYGSINADIEHKSGAYAWLVITITEGKNREVRKVLEHLGLKVARLIRVGYGPFELGELPVRGVDQVPDDIVSRFRSRLPGK